VENQIYIVFTLSIPRICASNFTIIFMLSSRVLKPEMLDSAPPVDAERNLRDIARINRWFGGHRALLQVMDGLAGCREIFSVLDVGAASGDMGARIHRRFPLATVTALDRRGLHLRCTKGTRVIADAFHLPFRPASFDFVFCSSFLHHFPDGVVMELIASMHRVARRALVILDLERHPLAGHFLVATRGLLRWNQLTVHDGLISVGAGFRVEEIAALARAAVPVPATVRRHWPWFRISVVVPVTSPGESSSPALEPQLAKLVA
jgi:SAM-dependent methyltransferase